MDGDVGCDDSLLRGRGLRSVVEGFGVADSDLQALRMALRGVGAGVDEGTLRTAIDGHLGWARVMEPALPGGHAIFCRLDNPDGVSIFGVRLPLDDRIQRVRGGVRLGLSGEGGGRKKR